MTADEWERKVRSLCQEFGLGIRNHYGEVQGMYCGYAVIGNGYNCFVVYDIKKRVYFQTQNEKYARKCIKEYMVYIKEMITKFRENSLNEDFV